MFPSFRHFHLAPTARARGTGRSVTIRLQLEKCRLNAPPGHSSRIGNLDGVAQKLENAIDVLSRGTAHVLRPDKAPL